MSNLTKLEELRNQTYQDAYDKLHTWQMCHYSSDRFW